MDIITCKQPFRNDINWIFLTKLMREYILSKVGQNLQLYFKYIFPQVLFEDFAINYKLFSFLISSEFGGYKKPLLVLNGKKPSYLSRILLLYTRDNAQL